MLNSATLSSGILPGISFDALSGTSSGLQAGISSGILSGVLPGVSAGSLFGNLLTHSDIGFQLAQFPS